MSILVTMHFNGLASQKLVPILIEMISWCPITLPTQDDALCKLTSGICIKLTLQLNCPMVSIIILTVTVYYYLSVSTHDLHSMPPTICWTKPF